MRVEELDQNLAKKPLREALLFRYVSTNCHGHLLKFEFDGLPLTKVSKRFQKFGNFEHQGASCALARVIALPRTKL